MAATSGGDRPPPSERPGERGRGRSEAVSAAAYAGLGLQFVLAILLFLFLGNWVDRRIGTSPLFLIAGVFIGAGAAFYSIYRRLMADQARDERARADRAGDR